MEKCVRFDRAHPETTLTRIAKVLALALIAAWPIAGGASQQDAGTLLAAAREAMGGEKAFNAIATLEVFGSVAQTAKAGTIMNIEGFPVASAVGGRLNMSLDLKLALPDKFVRINKYEPPGLATVQDVTEFRGFNGGDVIRDSAAQSGGLNDSKNAPSPNLPATRLQYLLDAKHSFAELMLPLLAASYDAYPFEFGVGEEERLTSGPAMVVTVSSADGLRWKLFLDKTTHLPVLMTGTMKPMVSGLFVEYDMPEEDWRMEITDYRVSNGFKWPHKLMSAIGDKIVEDIHYDRFVINPKIDPKTFTPSNGR